MVVVVQPRLSIIFIISKEGWCGESHTLPYPGYTTVIIITIRFKAHPQLCTKLGIIHVVPCKLSIFFFCQGVHAGSGASCDIGATQWWPS